MAHSRASLEQLSIFYYLKEAVLANEFSQEVQNEALTYDTKKDITGTQRTDYFIVDPNTSAYGTLPVSKGRGWLSFSLNEVDPCMIYDVNSGQYVSIINTPFKNGVYQIPTVRETDLVIVRDQTNSILPRDYYQIDYTNGRIRWPAPTTPSGALSQVPTTVDYRFHMVSMLDGYPQDEDIPQLPIVSLYPLKDEHKPLQIGPGIKFVRRYCIDVFANNNSEKRNILDSIHTSLYNKPIPVIDFNRTGEPLKHWGVVNEDFIQDISYKGNTYRSYLTLNQGNGNLLHFLEIEVMYNTSPRDSRSDSLQHMGKITFSTITQTDRDPKLVGKFSNLDPPAGGFDSLIDLDSF